METSIFTYCICEKSEQIGGFSKCVDFGDYYVFLDNNTKIDYSKNGNSECLIIGLAVNVTNGECTQLADKLLTRCNNIDEVIDFERYMGGKYIIFYRYKEDYFLIGDATTSIPIFYSKEKKLICSDNMHIIYERIKCVPNTNLRSIRRLSNISQAMPNDVTEYEEIKQLLPNHYLDFNKKKAIRFVNSYSPQKKLSIEQVTETVNPMIRRMVRFYNSQFKMYCPITSGRDSRVVLSYLYSIDHKIQCYTIKHDEHSDEEQDLVIPLKLCETESISYEIIKDINLSDERKKIIDKTLGEGKYSNRTLVIAETIKEHFSDGAIVNGDIIGQIGKCSLHRDIPLFFATPRYFRCKLHNYSSLSLKELKTWLNGIKSSKEMINTFDLFSVENRLGRWASQENQIYNVVGQRYVNIFNSRSIIYAWTAVSRKERKKSKIHLELIKENMPNLLNIDFEKDDNIFIKISKCTGISYWMSSYMKYYIEKIIFMRKNK